MQKVTHRQRQVMLYWNADRGSTRQADREASVQSSYRIQRQPTLSSTNLHTCAARVAFGSISFERRLGLLEAVTKRRQQAYPLVFQLSSNLYTRSSPREETRASPKINYHREIKNCSRKRVETNPNFVPVKGQPRYEGGLFTVRRYLHQSR